MRKTHFLPVCCLVLLASAMMARVDSQAASANDCVDLSCTEVCGSCGTDACACGGSACDQCYLFPQKDCGVNLRGWLAAGFVGNTSDPDSKFNGPYNAVDRANEPMANQAYLIGERALPQCGWGLGARVDVLYGLDFNLAQSLGFEVTPDVRPRWNSGEYYGLAVPQVYANIGNQDFSFQVGHFYSIVGYEGLMAPDNFFYSKSYSYQFAGPFQHWGGQMNWNLNDVVDVAVGSGQWVGCLGSRERRSGRDRPN